MRLTATASWLHSAAYTTPNPPSPTPPEYRTQRGFRSRGWCGSSGSPAPSSSPSVMSAHLRYGGEMGERWGRDGGEMGRHGSVFRI